MSTAASASALWSRVSSKPAKILPWSWTKEGKGKFQCKNLVFKNWFYARFCITKLRSRFLCAFFCVLIHKKSKTLYKSFEYQVFLQCIQNIIIRDIQTTPFVCRQVSFVIRCQIIAQQKSAWCKLGDNLLNKVHEIYYNETSMKMTINWRTRIFYVGKSFVNANDCGDSKSHIQLFKNIELTECVGKHALRMASELECRGEYFGSCKIGCILKGCLLFMDIMMAEGREGRSCLPRLSPFDPNAISASDRSADTEW